MPTTGAHYPVAWLPSPPPRPLTSSSPTSLGFRVLIGSAALVLVIAGLRAAEAIVIPLLLALFLAVIGAPPVFALRRRGVPGPLAVLGVVAALGVIAAAVGAVVGNSLADFTASLPLYQDRLREQTALLFAWAVRRGLELSEQELLGMVEPGAVMVLVARLLSGLGGALANAALIALTVVFILLEAADFPGKLRVALGSTDASLDRFRAFAGELQSYLKIKTVVSLATGLLITLWLGFLGVDFPVLWGMLAFLLNYIPNIGSILAAIPAVLLASVQLGGGAALAAAAGYLLVNFVIGNVLEPRIMGRGLGLSTLVVFLSLVFWGWVFGAVGMLLSVPLTMTIKLALESSPGTRWAAVLLGPDGNSAP